MRPAWRPAGTGRWSHRAVVKMQVLLAFLGGQGPGDAGAGQGHRLAGVDHKGADGAIAGCRGDPGAVGSEAIALSTAVSSNSIASSSPVAVSHTLTVLSNEDEIRCQPSGPKGCPPTGQVCPGRARNSAPEATSRSGELA